MSTRYATALSHIVLTGTGIYCYLHVKDSALIFPHVSFLIIIFHSVIGIWRWGNPSYGYNSIKLYKLTSLLQDLLALPCIVSTEWLQYGYSNEIAYSYILFSGLLFIVHFFNKNSGKLNDDLLNFVTGLNCLTLGELSYGYQNYFGMAASLSYAFSHFIIKNDNQTYFNVTSQDLYNYAMCFFAFFALQTVLD